jgi:hypothetical protein
MRRAFLCTVISASLGFVGVATAAPLAPLPGPAIETVQYLPGSGFPYPHEGGAIVDWCAVWADGCGCQARINSVRREVSLTRSDGTYSGLAAPSSSDRIGFAKAADARDFVL